MPVVVRRSAMANSNNQLAPNTETNIESAEVTRMPIDEFEEVVEQEDDLLLDEADSIFEKRSEVRDSHDR
jgi:hypothetical protein